MQINVVYCGLNVCVLQKNKFRQRLSSVVVPGKSYAGKKGLSIREKALNLYKDNRAGF